MNKYKHIIFLSLIAVLCFAIDLISKIIANNNLVLFERNEVIPNFFYLTLCYNTGGAWSIFSGNTIFLIIISLIAVGAVVYTLTKSKTKFYMYSSAVFVGGLLGNLYDRIFYSKVTDFLDFIIFGYDFPVFNIADCFICVSVALMLIAMIREEKNNGKDSI